MELIRESTCNPPAHARRFPKGKSHVQTRALEKILETGLNIQRSRLGLNGRSVQHPGIVILPNWANFSVHHPEDSRFFAEPQFELSTRSLRRRHNDSVFFN